MQSYLVTLVFGGGDKLPCAHLGIVEGASREEAEQRARELGERLEEMVCRARGCFIPDDHRHKGPCCIDAHYWLVEECTRVLPISEAVAEELRSSSERIVADG